MIINIKHWILKNAYLLQIAYIAFFPLTIVLHCRTAFPKACVYQTAVQIWIFMPFKNCLLSLWQYKNKVNNHQVFALLFTFHNTGVPSTYPVFITADPTTTIFGLCTSKSQNPRKAGTFCSRYRCLWLSWCKEFKFQQQVSVILQKHQSTVLKIRACWE